MYTGIYAGSSQFTTREELWEQSGAIGCLKYSKLIYIKILFFMKKFSIFKEFLKKYIYGPEEADEFI